MKKNSQNIDIRFYDAYIQIIKANDTPTISKLCQATSLNRTTFYRHFETKEIFEKRFIKYFMSNLKKVTIRDIVFLIENKIDDLKTYQSFISKFIKSDEIKLEILNEINQFLNENNIEEINKAKLYYLIGGLYNVFYAYFNNMISADGFVISIKEALNNMQQK